MGNTWPSQTAVWGFLVCLSPIAQADSATTQPADLRRQEQRLSFQTDREWSPAEQLNADVAMVYGIDSSLPARVQSWRNHGYIPELMTGASWGNYQDYLYGRFDGINHEDEAQTDHNGNKVGHGGDVFYMCPGPTYGEYLATGVRRALDAGVGAVYLEEPEFWVKSGWSPAFKREWKDFYHEDWQSPDSSSDAQYRASKLKYFLYRRALAQVFASVKKWSDEHGQSIPCYVPTHSLINYAQWRIVSPESSLLQVGCDGYIAQVWTGTARTPNYYEGRKKERTFETAFLEYGAMQNLVRASGRRVWYLNDPIEDNPNHTWGDYRNNWQSTLTASLLQPEVWRYEIMPWPHRIFYGRYPTTMPVARRGGRSPIPEEYRTELQSVVSALGDMKQPPDAIRWEKSGTQGIGVLVSDTLMFERGGPDPSDIDLGSFYGLALPMLKHGVPVEPVQIEAAGQKGFLDRYKILLLTYEGQKPPAPAFHEALAAWVNAGGALVIVDDDRDTFNSVREWWNTAPMRYSTPRLHLFEQMGLKPADKFPAEVGKGCVIYDAASPATISHDPGGANHVRDLVQQAAAQIHEQWIESDAMVLHRGPYIVAAAMDESVPDAKPYVLHGRLVPLFDAKLPVIGSYELTPGTRQVLLDLDALPAGKVGTVASACRVLSENVSAESIKMRVDGLEGSKAVLLIALPAAPQGLSADGVPLPAGSYEYGGGILRVRFTNAAKGIDLTVTR